MSFWSNLLKPNDDISPRDKIEQQEEKVKKDKAINETKQGIAKGRVSVTVDDPNKTIISADDNGVKIQTWVLGVEKNSFEVSYSAIDSVQFTSGVGGAFHYLTLNVRSGHDERPIGLGTADIGGYSGSFVTHGVGKNTVRFTPEFDDQIHMVQHFIQRHIDALKQPAAAQLDPADQIAKFKKLADQGIITQEEFEAKKKQLLGL